MRACSSPVRGVVYQFAVGPVLVHQVAALGVEHLGLALGFGAYAFEDCGHVDGQRPVVAQGVALLVGVGSAHGNGLHPVDVERQQAVGVLQQHDALARGLQGHGLVLGAFHLGVGCGQVGLVGRVKQSREELHPQDVAHAVVYGLHAQAAFGHQLAQRLYERLGRAEGAAHVQARLYALAHGLLHVLGRAVFGVQVFHGIAVRNDVSLEAHLPAQPRGEPVVAALYGHAVVVVIRAHDAQQPGLANDAAERVDVYQLHLAGRHLRVDARHALACSFVVAVGHEVLGRGCHLVVVLHSAHHSNAQLGHEVGRLAVDLFVAAPTLVAAHVEHRSIDVGVAQHPCLAAGDEPYLIYEVAVPRVSQSQLGGEVGGAVALNPAYALVGEVRRNAQPCLFDEEPLHFVQCPGMARGRPYVFVVRRWHSPLLEAVEVLVNGTYAVLPQFVFPFGRRQVVLQHALVSIQGDHLAGLFLQRHLPQQVLYAGVNGG